MQCSLPQCKNLQHIHELELHRAHQDINIPSWPKLSAITNSSSFMSEIREHFDLWCFSVQCINKFIFHLTTSRLLNVSSFVSVRKARILLKYISLSELLSAKTTYTDQENKLQGFFLLHQWITVSQLVKEILWEMIVLFYWHVWDEKCSLPLTNSLCCT